MSCFIAVAIFVFEYDSQVQDWFQKSLTQYKSLMVIEQLDYIRHSPSYSVCWLAIVKLKVAVT